MTSETYFPEQRHLLPSTVIRRERALPDYARGSVEVVVNSRVSLNDVIAHGVAPAPYTLIDAAAYFRLRNPDALDRLMEVIAGDRIEQGQTIAIRRGKRLLSPISGSVVYVGQGRIILQETAESIDVEAGLNGVVTQVQQGRGVTIEALGAVLQGVWGNNRRAIGHLRVEPSHGLEDIYRDALDMEYRGAVVVTRRPLSAATLQIMDEQSFVGVVAPSMEPDLLDAALTAGGAILLTEGFGSMPMSVPNLQFLEDMVGRQATMDAMLPTPLEPRRPELIITGAFAPGARPPAPETHQPLREGATVRLASGEAAGSLARVVRLPKAPILMENGLRMTCALVELVTGEQLTVPLANMDALGS
jgi:hypothetical protein